MSFTLGNLIVLLAACVVIIIFRQYDRNNRSLRQVKKYADSVRAELERVVQDRVNQVRDLTINFDVHRQRGRALAEQLNQIGSRSEAKIGEHRQQLNHLDKKVKNTLEAVSRLDIYYKTSNEKFSHFQKDIQHIERQFERVSKDAESLEEFGGALPKMVTEQRERFQVLIDTKYHALVEQIAKANTVCGEQTQSIQRLVNDGGAEIQRVGQEAQRKIATIARAVSARESKQRKGLTGHISELRSQQERTAVEIRAQYTKRLDLFIAEQRDVVAVKMERILAQRLQEAQRRQDEVLKRWQADDRTTKANFLKEHEARLQELTGTIDASIEELNADGERMLTEAHNTHDTQAQTFNEVRQKLAALYTESEQQLSGHDTQLQTMIQAQEQAVRAETEHLKERLDVALTTLKDELEQRMTGIGSELEVRFGEVSDAASTRLATLTTQSQAAKGAIDEAVATLTARAEQQIQEIGSAHATQVNAFKERSESFGTEFDTLFAALKGQASRRITEVSEELERSLVAMRAQSEHTDEAVSEGIAVVKARAEHEMQEVSKQLSDKLLAVSEQSQRIDEELQELQRHTDARVAAITREVSTALERAQRVQKIVQEQEQRFKSTVTDRMEAFDEQIETSIGVRFDGALGQAQKAIADVARMEERYQLLSDEHGRRVEDHVQEFEHKIEKIVRAGAQKLDAIQKTLNSYADKMQRDQQLTKQQFTELGEEAQRQRQSAIAKIQHEYQHRLQKQVERIQIYLQKQTKKIDNAVNVRIEQLQGHIDERVTAHREELMRSVSVNTELLEKQWGEMTIKNSRALQDLQQTNQLVEDHRDKFERALSDVESRITAQQELVSSKVKEIHAHYDQVIEDELGNIGSVFNEKSDLQNVELMQRLERMGGDFNERLEHEKKRLMAVHTEEITALMTDNVTQLQQLSNQEREHIFEQQTQIREEISQSRSEIEQLRKSVHKYGADLHSEFATKYNNMTSVTEESFNQVQDQLQTSQLKFNKEHEATLTSIGRETKRLHDELVKVQGAQRNINEHSKALDKAMVLQRTLSNSVEVLHADVERLETQHEGVRRMEQEFIRVQDTAQKLQRAFTRISSERRKIDTLEKNWKHLDALSGTVERNLGKMHVKYEHVQELQVRLRELDELEKDVSLRYDHLSNQQNIIHATIEGVEKNFDNLSTIEERLKQIDAEIKDLPHHVSELSEQVAVLQNSTLTAEQARAQYKQLDKMLAKLEKRMTEVKNSQKWLGGVETRLQKIYSEADGKISLMHSLVQNQAPEESATYNDDKMPDTIKQLARRGWTPEQISSALKVSIGEIEVVLGMAANSR